MNTKAQMMSNECHYRTLGWYCVLPVATVGYSPPSPASLILCYLQSARSWEESVHELEARLRKTELEAKEMDARNRDAMQEIMADAQHTAQRHEATEQELNEAQAEVDELHELLQEARKEAQEAKQQSDATSAVISDLTAQVVQEADRADQAEGALEATRREHEAVKTQLATLEETLNESLTHLVVGESQEETPAEKPSDLLQSVEVLTQEVMSLQQKLKASTEAQAQLTIQYQAREEEVAELEGQLTDVQGELEEELERRAPMGQELKQLQESEAVLHEAMAKAGQELARMRGIEQRAVAEADRYRATCDSLQETVAALLLVLKAQTSSLQSLKAENDTLTGHQNKAQKIQYTNRIKAENVHLSHQVNRLREMLLEAGVANEKIRAAMETGSGATAGASVADEEKQKVQAEIAEAQQAILESAADSMLDLVGKILDATTGLELAVDLSEDMPTTGAEGQHTADNDGKHENELTERARKALIRARVAMRAAFTTLDTVPSSAASVKRCADAQQWLHAGSTTAAEHTKDGKSVDGVLSPGAVSRSASGAVSKVQQLARAYQELQVQHADMRARLAVAEAVACSRLSGPAARGCEDAENTMPHDHTTSSPHGVRRKLELQHVSTTGATTSGTEEGSRVPLAPSMVQDEVETV